MDKGKGMYGYGSAHALARLSCPPLSNIIYLCPIYWPPTFSLGRGVKRR